MSFSGEFRVSNASTVSQNDFSEDNGQDYFINRNTNVNYCSSMPVSEEIHFSNPNAVSQNLLKDEVQIRELQKFHEKYVDDVAREKNSALLKLQQMEQEYQISLKNERHQHNVDIDIVSQEKEALRGRMVSAIDELFERHQKQQDELLSQHQEEIASLKKQITTLEREYEEKIHFVKDDSRKVQRDFKQQIITLEHTIENLKTKLCERKELYDILKEKYDRAEREHHILVEENADILKRLKDEMNNLR
ncbi:rootletin [Trichonephila clavipes]|nr:rootletin [Trichonephila clavipes]